MNDSILQPTLLNINVGGLTYKFKIRAEDGGTLKATNAYWFKVMTQLSVLLECADSTPAT